MSTTLQVIPTLTLTLLLLHACHAESAHLPPTRHDFHGNRKTAVAGIVLSVVALILSIAAFLLMLYNRRMRALDNERYRARAHAHEMQGQPAVVVVAAAAGPDGKKVGIPAAAVVVGVVEVRMGAA